MTNEEAKSLPIIRKMPVISLEVWQTIRKELDQSGERYYWSIGADLVKTSPEHKDAYEEALRDTKPPEIPDATMATVLLVLRALEVQARNDGYQLPEIPSPINPLPALGEFIPRSKGKMSTLIDIVYGELVRDNPVYGDIVRDMSIGAPDEVLRITTESQVKRGIVYAFYGVRAVIPRQR